MQAVPRAGPSKLQREPEESQQGIPRERPFGARDQPKRCSSSAREALAEGFSLVAYEGGTLKELADCAESRRLTTLYALREGDYLAHILGAPAFVNRDFIKLFAEGVPELTPLIVTSDGPVSADPVGDVLGLTALYVLHEGRYVLYILGAPAFVNREFGELFTGRRARRHAVHREGRATKGRRYRPLRAVSPARSEPRVRPGGTHWISLFAGACRLAAADAERFEAELGALQASWTQRLGACAAIRRWPCSSAHSPARRW